jgi:voltage-gated potassium channel
MRSGRRQPEYDGTEAIGEAAVARPLSRVFGWVFLHGRVTVFRAAVGISVVTLAITLVSAALMRLADESNFNSFGEGLWWAVQTVTTVGYGDRLPGNTAGKAVAVVVMLTGIAFISVLTAAIAAGFLEAARRRLAASSEHSMEARLDRIDERLAAIEARLPRQDAGPGGPA